MLNPDYTVAPIRFSSSAPKVAINEVRDWTAFANHSGRNQTTIKGRTYPTVSVESFHDGIHNLIGTGGSDRSPVGHMGNPQVAGVSIVYHRTNLSLICV